MNEAQAELRNKIRDYMSINVFLEPDAAYRIINKERTIFSFPFSVIAPNKKKYPINRTFALRIVYAIAPYVPPLRRAELATDFGNIHISDTQTDYREAEAQAIAFIESKIAEVHENYRNNRGNMEQIYDSSDMPCQGDYIVEEERPGDVMDIVVIPEPVKERKRQILKRRRKEQLQ